jgi:hypothetical protein
MVDRLRKLNIEPLVLLDYCVAWAQRYTKEQMTWRHRAFGPPDRLADWQAYVKTVATALKGKARFYEAWNEPDAGYLASGQWVERPDVVGAVAKKSIYRDNTEYWLGDRYVPMVSAARAAIDAVDPEAELWAGSWNRDYNGDRGRICFDRGMFRYFQQYSFHNYVGGAHSFARWEQFAANKFFANADQRAFRPHEVRPPIAITEWGMSSYDQPPATAGWVSRHDAQLFLLKSTLYYLSLERVTTLIQHDLVGNPEDGFALVHENADGTLTYMPAFETYRWLCQAFSRKAYKRLPLTIEGVEAAGVRTLALNLPEDKAIYVAMWQDRLDVAGAPVALPAARVRAALQGIPDGDYVRQTLDITGKVTTSANVQAQGGLRWDDQLPAGTGQAEPEVVVYRLEARAK